MKQEFISHILLYLLLSTSSLIGEGLWEAQIIDDNQAPIPYATIQILNQNKGTFSNEEGFFSLDIQKNDTIKITHIEYTDKVPSFKDIKPLIQLESKINTLSTVVISPNEDAIVIGTEAEKKQKMRVNISSYIEGRFFEFEEGKEFVIQSFSIPISPSKYTVRVRLNTYSMRGGHPDTLIHSEFFKLLPKEKQKILTVDYDTPLVISNEQNALFAIEILGYEKDGKIFESLEKSRQTLKTYLTWEISKNLTFISRSFDVSEGWHQVAQSFFTEIGKENPFNMVVHLEGYPLEE